MSDYLVIYEPAVDGSGWGAYLPDIDGVVALGATRRDVEAGIREALATFLEDLEERGQAIPPARTFAERIAA